jgi:hypothetical protein
VCVCVCGGGGGKEAAWGQGDPPSTNLWQSNMLLASSNKVMHMWCASLPSSLQFVCVGGGEGGH